jgi:hypothetical protein
MIGRISSTIPIWLQRSLDDPLFKQAFKKVEANFLDNVRKIMDGDSTLTVVDAIAELKQRVGLDDEIVDMLIKTAQAADEGEKKEETEDITLQEVPVTEIQKTPPGSRREFALPRYNENDIAVAITQIFKDLWYKAPGLRKIEIEQKPELKDKIELKDNETYCFVYDSVVSRDKRDPNRRACSECFKQNCDISPSHMFQEAVQTIATKFKNTTKISELTGRPLRRSVIPQQWILKARDIISGNIKRDFKALDESDKRLKTKILKARRGMTDVTSLGMSSCSVAGGEVTNWRLGHNKPLREEELIKGIIQRAKDNYIDLDPSDARTILATIKEQVDIDPETDSYIVPVEMMEKIRDAFNFITQRPQDIISTHIQRGIGKGTWEDILGPAFSTLSKVQRRINHDEQRARYLRDIAEGKILGRDLDPALAYMGPKEVRESPIWREKRKIDLAKIPNVENKKEMYDLFLNLATDPSPTVRETLAGNPTISEDVMEILSKDTEPKVLEALEKNRAYQTYKKYEEVRPEQITKQILLADFATLKANVVDFPEDITDPTQPLPYEVGDVLTFRDGSKYEILGIDRPLRRVTPEGKVKIIGPRQNRLRLRRVSQNLKQIKRARRLRTLARQVGTIGEEFERKDFDRNIADPFRRKEMLRKQREKRLGRTKRKSQLEFNLVRQAFVIPFEQWLESTQEQYNKITAGQPSVNVDEAFNKAWIATVEDVSDTFGYNLENEVSNPEELKNTVRKFISVKP